MNCLSNILGQWQNVPLLESTIPHSKVFTGLVPRDTTFPYCIMTLISNVPTYTTGQPYFETNTFQLGIFDKVLSNVESMCTAIDSCFNKAQMFADAPLGFTIFRTNYFVEVEPGDPDPTPIYQGILVYDYSQNKH